MCIEKVEISGLWQRYDLVWNLNPDVNVLAGINGSGKSTILNCISAHLIDKKESTLGHEEINNVDIVLKNSGEMPSDDNYKINVNLIKTFDTELKSQEILQKINKQAKTELDLKLWKLQKEYTKYQVRIYKYNSEINRNTHIRFVSMMNELFSETQKKVNPDKEELEFLSDNKEITPFQLSSGEKQLLIILLTVLVQDNKPFVLLIDEPEISLHFEWQENLINYIRELNPNVQLIIATHSADLIMKGWGDRVFEVRDLIVKDCTMC